MLLLLRCDSGLHRGVGHVLRSLAVAEEALRRGWQVELSGEVVDPPWVADAVTTLGLAVHPPLADGRSLAVLAKERGARVVLVDHYELPSDLHLHLAEVGVLMVGTEDHRFGRRRADIVVDPNLGAEGAPRADDGSAVLLRGVDYVLLRDAILRARRRRRATAASDRLRVAVVMGGTDPAGLIPQVQRALDATGLTLEVTSGPRQDFAAGLASADLAVTAAGSTMWELCYLGVPMAVIQVADNQERGYQSAVRAGVAVGLGGVEDLRAGDQVVDRLRVLLSDPTRLTALGLSGSTLVDGRGRKRVLDAVEAAAGRFTGRNPTPGDAELLLAWRNDGETRRWSRSTEPVSPPDHARWLDSVLVDPDRRLLVVEDERQPVGTVRFDRLQDRRWWEVSITVAPEHRGGGTGTACLAAGERWLSANDPAVLGTIAHVHPENEPSRRLFEAAGYSLEAAADEQGFARLRKRLARGNTVG